QVRELLERADERLRDERHVRELHAALGGAFLHLAAQRDEFGDVEVVHVGEVRGGRLALVHPLADLLAQTADRDALLAARRGRFVFLRLRLFGLLDALRRLRDLGQLRSLRAARLLRRFGRHRVGGLRRSGLLFLRRGGRRLRRRRVSAAAAVAPAAVRGDR